MAPDAPGSETDFATIRDHLKDYVRQGSIFDGLPLPNPVPSDVGEQGGLSLAVVLTQTCDVVKHPEKEPWVHVARVWAAHPDDSGSGAQRWNDIRVGKLAALFALPVFEPDRPSYVDLRTVVPVNKEEFYDRRPVYQLTDPWVLLLQKAIVRRFTRPAIADDVTDYVTNPLRDKIIERIGKSRKAVERERAEHQRLMFDEVERLLVSYDEEDGSVVLCFLLDSNLVDPDDDEQIAQVKVACEAAVEYVRRRIGQPFSEIYVRYDYKEAMSLLHFESYQVLDLAFLSPED